MNKMQMAHEYVMNYLGNPACENTTVSNVISVAWAYADAMQAEADKRDKVEAEEWQPDWSVAPGWAKWWAMDGFGEKRANWYASMPYIDDDSYMESEWNVDLKINQDTYSQAPSFGYTGNWQHSLRKRPK